MWVVLALLLLETVSQINGGALITCNAPAVRKGDPANITCSFPEDVSLTKKNIKVQRLSSTSQANDRDTADTVVDCYWLNADDFKCNLEDGYKLIGAVGQKAIVHVPYADEKSVGKYMCETVPIDQSESELCDFQLKEETGLKSLTVYIPGQYQDQLDALSSGVTAAVVISVIVLIIVLLLLLQRNWQFLRELLTKCLAAKSGGKGAEKQNTEMEDVDSGKPLIPGDEENNKGGVPKERIEHYIEVLIDMKDNGTLKQYLEEVRDARGKSESGNPPAHEMDTSRGPYGGTQETGEEGKVSAGHPTREEHQRLPPVQLGAPARPAPPQQTQVVQPRLTDKEKAERDREDIKMRTAEQAALEEVESVKKRHEAARRLQEEEDRRNNKNESNLTKKEKNERERAEKKRAEELKSAQHELDVIRRRNEAALKRRQSSDSKRLEREKRARKARQEKEI